MKQKVSQKEWNDKRDAFLCAAITVGYSKEMSVSDYTNLVNFAESITSELYELEQKLVQQYEKAMFMGQEFDNLSRPITESNPQPTDNPNEQFTPCSFPPKGEELVCIAGEPNTLDTRPFNSKVFEIFNEFLPKEIAPLAIEAHKRSIQEDSVRLSYGFYINLKIAINVGIKWILCRDLGNWMGLHDSIRGNTISATPKQLRNWFPQAYENETSELVMLVKENYLAADESIKKGILKDGNWYAPANDLYKNEGGENE